MGTQTQKSAFHSSDAWQVITRLAKKAKRADVAVAWCSSGVGRLLPLKAGSVLVTDASEAAVKAGQTNPSELIPLANRGVAIHSYAGLHAKVFVFGKLAVVGSTNVSARSKNELVEAIVVVRDRATVSAAREFVRSLRGDRLGIDELKRLQKIYRPPKFGGRGTAAKLKPTPFPTLWAVSLIQAAWSPETKDRDRKAKPKARVAMESRSNSLDSFHWTGRMAMLRDLKRGDLMLQLHEPEPGRPAMVSPPGRVAYVKRWGRKKPEMLVYVEEPRGARRKAMSRFKPDIRPYGTQLERIASSRRIADRAFASRILGAWET